MSMEHIRESAFAYFDANFTDAEKEFENLDVIDPSTRTEPYVSVSMRLGLSEQVTLNPTPITRERGNVQVDIYVKKGTGTKAAYTLGDKVTNVFKRKSISGIEFATPSALNPLEVNGWWRLTIRCPYYFDE